MTVRLFYSTETGLGGMTGVAGSAITALDKIFINGYNSQSITSITRSGATATATKTTHGFRTGQYVTISGANETDYNGSFQITNVTANTFDYTVANSPATPATGTLNGLVTPLGWTKPYTGTNLAAYRQPAGSNQYYLRLDDTGTTLSRFVGYESMSDVNTGTNAFPTNVQLSGGLYLAKSSTANATVRDFILVSNQKCFYLFVDTSTDSFTSSQGHFFGDLTTYKSADAYHTAIICPSTATATTGNVLQTCLSTASTTTAGHYVARSYTQIGGSTQMGKYLDYLKGGNQSTVGAGAMTYPNPVDGGLWLTPVWVAEGAASSTRGVLPGFWSPLHNKPLGQGDTYNGSGDLAGKQFLAINMYSSAQVHMEISNTW